MLYAGLMIGAMTLVVADVAAQDSPDVAGVPGNSEASAQSLVHSPSNSQAPSYAPPANDDVQFLLLLLAAATSGVIGAQMLPRWRSRQGQAFQSGFEENAMKEPDLSKVPDMRPEKVTSAPSAEPVKPEPVSTPVIVPSSDLASIPQPGPQPAEPAPAAPPPAEVAASPPPEAAVVAPVSPPRATEAPQPSSVDALRETRSSHAHQSWGSFDRDAVPRLLFYGGSKFCQFSADKLHAADEWFVIGDIHGDFYALHTIVSHIRKACPQFGIIFLGDLIDRGPHPVECLWYLLKLADDHPERVLWLAGNHDVGVRYNEETGQFRSSVEPAEFVADLNIIDSFAPLRRAFGREYIELAEGLPRAALMPDGLLLTHGGFPHTDLQTELAALTLNSDRRKWLESEAVVRDFTHLRITKYPVRRPNRLSISCSYGYQDFDAFKRSMSGYGIKRLVTGHQHAATGFDDHPDWARNGHEALTLTGFGFADAYDRLDSYGANYRRTLTVGRCRPDQIPEVVQIPVDEGDLTGFYEVEIKTMRRFAAS